MEGIVESISFCCPCYEMMLGKIGRRRIWIGTSERFRLVGRKPFSTNNKPTIEPNKNGENTDGSLTHHDSYRDLDKLDFMTAAKILFTTPPKKKKFGLDFHLVQLFFVCLPSLAVYLVAQYARHEMKIMDAELERRRAEEAKKLKAAEGEVLKSSPEIVEVKERLENLEKTVQEMVTESKNQRSRKEQEHDKTHHLNTQWSNKPGETHNADNRKADNTRYPNTQPSNKTGETQDADNRKGRQGGGAK